MLIGSEVVISHLRGGVNIDMAATRVVVGISQVL